MLLFRGIVFMMMVCMVEGKRMAHAEKCPVCDGSGQVHGPSSRDTALRECHGCSGRGWVEVSDPEPKVFELREGPVDVRKSFWSGLSRRFL